MTKQNQHPTSFEEALQARPEMTTEEMTTMEVTPNEVITQEEVDMEWEEKLKAPEPETTPTRTMVPPCLAVPTSPPQTQPIPASTISPPPVVVTSTPESPDDIVRQKLTAFVFGGDFGIEWIRQCLTYISSSPNVLPSSTQWALPWNLDIASMVYEIVRGPSYVNLKWPGLSVVMGQSVDNTEWCAKVLCTMALFDGIHMLGKLKDMASRGANE